MSATMLTYSTFSCDRVRQHDQSVQELHKAWQSRLQTAIDDTRRSCQAEMKVQCLPPSDLSISIESDAPGSLFQQLQCDMLTGLCAGSR